MSEPEINPTKEELAIIDEYEFESYKRSELTEANMQAALKALESITAENTKYLKYAQAKHFFSMTPEEEKETALHNALVSVVSRAFKWEPYDAEKFAFEILQDVNLHHEAAAVQKLLKLSLKPYEME
jgi:hypothetical protein